MRILNVRQILDLILQQHEYCAVFCVKRGLATSDSIVLKILLYQPCKSLSAFT